MLYGFCGREAKGASIWKKGNWALKIWMTSKEGPRLQVIFQRTAWTLEGTWGNQIVFWGKGRAEGAAEIAEKKEETEKSPEEERFQRRESEWKGIRVDLVLGLEGRIFRQFQDPKIPAKMKVLTWRRGNETRDSIFLQGGKIKEAGITCRKGLRLHSRIRIRFCYCTLRKVL